MADKHKDQDFLKFVVEHIVEHPEDVKIERKVDEMGVLLSLHVHSDDMGQVIGRKGSTARALRTLLRIVGLKEDARVNLKIEEPEGSSKPKSSKKKASSSDDEDELKL